MTNEEKAHLWVEHASAGVVDLDVIEREIVAALTEARREALEEAAGIFDRRAEGSEQLRLAAADAGNSYDARVHQRDANQARMDAAAIRALLPQPETCGTCGGTKMQTYVAVESNGEEWRGGWPCPTCQGGDRNV